MCFASLASFTLGNVCGLIPVYTAVFGGNCMNSLNLKYTVTLGLPLASLPLLTYKLHSCPHSVSAVSLLMFFVPCKIPHYF